MSETPYADFLIRLGHDADGVRHVRTPEGAAFFHLPVGAPITEALYQKIKSEHIAKGHLWPKGMTTKNAKKVETGGFGNPNGGGGPDAIADAEEAAAKAGQHAPAVPSAPHAPAAPHAGAPAAPEAPHVPVPPQKPSPVKAPTIEGPNKFSVGTVKYSAPAGSRIYTPTNNSGLAVVVTPDNQIHAFNAKGEIHIEDPIVKAAMSAKFTPDFQGDQHYSVGHFDAAPGPADLPSLADGATLNDSAGVPQFTKTGPDEWTHAGLGVTMSSADVLPFVQSGELSVGTAEPGKDEQGHVDFASMDQPTFVSTLSGYKNGQVLYYKGQEITKTGPDKWSNGKTDNATSKDLWFIKNSLSDDKAASQEPAHLAPGASEPVPAAHAPAEDVPAVPAEAPAAPVEAPKTEAATPPGPPAPPAPPAPAAASEEPAPNEHKVGTDLKPGEKLTHPDQMKHMGADAKISVEGQNGTSTFTKKPAGMFAKKAMWQNEKTKQTSDDYQFHKSIQEGKVTLHSHPSAEDKKDEPKTEAPKAEKPKVEAPKAETSSEKPAEKPAEPVLTNGQDLKINEITKIPVGKSLTVTYTPPQGSGTQPSKSEYVRTSENGWKMVKKTPQQNPPTWTTSHLSQFISGKGNTFSYNEHPSEDAKAPEAPKAEAPKGPQFSDLAHGQTLKPEHIDSMKVGDTVFIPGGAKHMLTDKGFAALDSNGKTYQSPSNAKKTLKDVAAGGFLKAHKPAAEAPKEEPKTEAPRPKAEAPKELQYHEVGFGDKVSGQHIPQMKAQDAVYDHNTSTSWTKLEDGTFMVRKPDGQYSTGNQGPLFLQASQKDANITKMSPSSKAQIEKFQADQLASKKFEDLKHGDVVTAEHISQMKAGDQIKTADPGMAVKTKLEDGSFLHHVAGSPNEAKPANMTGEELGQFANNGSLVKHAPEVPDKPTTAIESGKEAASPGALAVGDTVPSVEHLHAMQPATVLNFTKKDGTTGQYTKLPNGNWLNPGGIQYEAHAFSKGIKDGKFTVASYPTSTAATEYSQSAHTLIPGGKVYSPEHLTQALNALQNHPSHQIAYGLKSLHEDNLLHEKHGNQNELKIGAASEFPNLKGKPGAIALLKKTLGIADNPVATTSATSDEEKIAIHAGDVKHSFTKSEIDNAKSILEGYQGKLWANELSKKGSPLGEMKWNDVIGFHKDKNEGKKEAIKLLDQKSKMFLAPEPEAPKEPTPEEIAKKVEDGPAPTAPTTSETSSEKKLVPGDTLTWEQFQAVPVGTVVHWENQNSDAKPYDATKMEGDTWKTDGSLAIPTAQWKAALDLGLLTLVSMPEQQKDEGPKPLTLDEFTNLKPGDHVEFTFKNGNTSTYIRQPDGTWIRTNDTTQTPRKLAYFQTFFETNTPGVHAMLVTPANDLPDYAKAPEAVTAKAATTDIEADTGHNQSGVLPGKWSSPKSGNYMIVNADGSATAYWEAGGTSELSPAKVKIMHEQTMTDYQGIPETTPTPQAEAPAAAPVKTTPAAKKVSATKKALPPVSLENGTYYLGDPKDWKTATYTVKDGQVTIKTNSGVNAGNEKTVPLEKIKTNFLAGKILDENGNSILPEGHTGSVTMWGNPMTTAALIEAKKFLSSDENGFFSKATQTELSKLGFYISPHTMQQKITKENPTAYADFGSPNQLYWSANLDNGWNQAADKILNDQIDQFLQHVDTTPPESNASGLFDWTANGEAIMPAGLVGPLNTGLNNLYDNSSLSNAVTAIKKYYGAKNVGGVTLSKHQKQQWLTAFQKGDFQSMYKIEVAAAASKGKPHPSGYLHPGYEANSETHQISWSAAVPGEIKAGDTVPGDWSTLSPANWSKEELANYLISAQMQNPEYLSLPEQRQWVIAHKAGSKLQTDNLSIVARTRHLSGEDPKSETPVWTDNLVPAKIYDHLFDANPFPTSDKWAPTQYEVSQAWAQDNWDNAEFQQVLHDNYGDQGELSGYSKYVIEAAVGKYFDGKHAEYQAELLKPVYTHVKVLAGGSHDVHLYQDQFGKKYVFKPVDDAHLFRAEVEDASSKLSNLWGFNTPKTDIKTMEVPGKGEQKGLIQNYQESVSDFRGLDGSGVDLTTLTDKQLGQLAAEHVLDWALDNDDAHEQNMLITPSGDLIGIDKGRGLFVYGNWNGLAGDTGAHTNMLPGHALAYTPLYDGIRNGTITKEQADAAYMAALKAAQRIKKSDNGAVSALIQAGVANRTKWAAPGYMTHFDHTQAPKNADDLVQAVLNRKDKIDQQITEMWQKIYSQAGLGDLPKPPPYVLGEQHLSGWQEPHTFQKVAETKIWGSSALHSSAEFADGHSLLWVEKGQDGSDVHFGSFKVAELSQKKLLDYIEPKAGVKPTLTTQQVAQFPNLSEWKSAISHAGKDVTKNAIDKNFNEEIQKKFSDTKALLQSDASVWTPNASPEADGMVPFPSGNKVPVEGLDQYKIALNHYLDMATKVDQAKENGLTTNKSDFFLYSPTAYAPEAKVYENANSELGTYKQLSNGQFIHSTPSGQIKMTTLPVEVANGENGWSAQASSTEEPQDAVLYHKSNAGDGIGELTPGGIKTQTSGWGSQGHPGSEYEITLPTGEKIYFRDSHKTSTATSQSGLLRFKLSGSDQAGSLARVEAHLQKMGLTTEGASPDQAESVYWRNMFHRLLMSNTNSSPAAIKSAKEDLQKMRSDLAKKLGLSTVEDQNLVEAIGLTMSSSEEQAFWKQLAEKAFGAQKVNEWISADKHLPQYSHMDLANPESTTGHAYWNRIDVTPQQLLEKNTLIAIGNSGKDNSLLKYITSGGMLSTEERLRVLGYWKDGASSTSDQGTGGATGVFTRIAVPGSAVEKTGNIYGAHVAYWNPNVLQQTGTYSYGTDEFGNKSLLQSHNKFDPMKSLSQNSGTGNETLIQHQLSILDSLEIMVFNDPAKRNEAIQRMKELGHEKLRGVPIEDRLIMRENLDQAMKVVKAAWTQQ